MIRSIIVAMILLMGALPFGVLPAAAQDSDLRLPEAIETTDGPLVDTALVFTNLGNADTSVAMKVWDAHGQALTSAEVKVPGNGLTYVFASRLAEEAGVDAFVGKVEARAAGHLTASAVLLGALTDLPVINRVRRVRVVDTTAADLASSTRPVSHMIFPLVATY